MKIFDVHTHVFPDKVAGRALEILQKKSNNLPFFSDGTLVGLSAHAAEVGYTGWLNAPVVTSVKQMISVNDWAAERNVWPHLSLGGIYPNAELDVIMSEAHRIKELGLLGIKLHPEYQEFLPLEERLAPFWELCRDLDLPLLFHTGRDIAYMDSHRAKPGDFRRLSQRHPGLKIICAHTGGWLDWQEALDDLVGSDVYLDTAFSLPWMEDKSMFETIIRRHGVKKVLFGTDSPWQDLKVGVAEILALSLTDAEKEDIFWNNANELFRLDSHCKKIS